MARAVASRPAARLTAAGQPANPAAFPRAAGIPHIPDTRMSWQITGGAVRAPALFGCGQPGRANRRLRAADRHAGHNGQEPQLRHPAGRLRAFRALCRTSGWRSRRRVMSAQFPTAHGA